MGKSVDRTEPIWAFGKKIDFKVYKLDRELHEDQYAGTEENPKRVQKTQIVLHYTGGNGTADGAVLWWNLAAEAPKYVCPKRWKAGKVVCTEGGAKRYECKAEKCGRKFNKRCPVHGTKQKSAIRCSKHKKKFGKGRVQASAQYCLELAGNRSDESQPYSDVVQVVPDDYVAIHGSHVNTHSIGIENANYGFKVYKVRIDKGRGKGKKRRPVDKNRWLHSKEKVRGFNDFQAYQEEQYRALILLLRHLCITHRIPRRFLGDTWEEKMKRWWTRASREEKSQLMRFRGILSHQNAHASKACGGPALHRNRLFRGISDEWWLPVQIDGKDRIYYSGPFDPQENEPSHFRWKKGKVEAHLFHDADGDALQETRSHYRLSEVEGYYSHCENGGAGGTFPIGTNKTWHGGVHFRPQDSNRKVYAAAGGTIVAARLGGDEALEKNPKYGSQRFVLVRHCVYHETEDDGTGGQQIKYSSDPTYVFSLSMHLAPPASLEEVDDENPPWLNYWIRNQKKDGDDPEKVFCPDVEVSVGDVLGDCGLFRGKPMLHFEVLSKHEFTKAPWNDMDFKVEDDGGDVICDPETLDWFLRDKTGDGIDAQDLKRAARLLRRVKSRHKSEWALEGPDALKPLLDGEKAREKKWKKLEPFMWVKDAVAACPDLPDQLTDAGGVMWHYHPITFMQFVNGLIASESQEIKETLHGGTNVAIEGEYLTKFVRMERGVAKEEAADGAMISPFAMRRDSRGYRRFAYHFRRKELACLAAGPHEAGQAKPTGTRFHMSLLDVVESIRVKYSKPLEIVSSHLCEEHRGEAQHPMCARGGEEMESHGRGHAIDIRPAGKRGAKSKDWKKLWDIATGRAAIFNESYEDEEGEPSRSDAPPGFVGIEVSAPEEIEDDLEAGKTIPAAKLAKASIHIELVEDAETEDYNVCGCPMPEDNFPFDEQTFELIEELQPLILKYSEEHGVPPIAVAGSIADEFNTRRGWRVLGDWFQDDVLLNSMFDSQIEFDSWIGADSKLLNATKHDIGVGNIKVETAKKMYERYKDTFDQKDMDWSDLVDYLRTREGTVHMAALVIKRAQEVLGKYIGDYSERKKEACLITFYKQGPSYVDRYEKKLAVNPEQPLKSGEGCRTCTQRADFLKIMAGEERTVAEGAED